MGIKSLSEYLISNNLFEKKCTLRNKCLIFDGLSLSYWIYQKFPSFLGKYTQLEQFIQEFVHTCKHINQCDICIVFDGCANELKNSTLRLRSKKKYYVLDRIYRISLENEHLNNNNNSTIINTKLSPPPLFIKHLIYQFNKLNCALIGTPEEADYILPILDPYDQNSNYCFFPAHQRKEIIILSDDTDILIVNAKGCNNNVTMATLNSLNFTSATTNMYSRNSNNISQEQQQQQQQQQQYSAAATNNNFRETTANRASVHDNFRDFITFSNYNNNNSSSSSSSEILPPVNARRKPASQEITCNIIKKKKLMGHLGLVNNNELVYLCIKLGNDYSNNDILSSSGTTGTITTTTTPSEVLDTIPTIIVEEKITDHELNEYSYLVLKNRQHKIDKIMNNRLQQQQYQREQQQRQLQQQIDNPDPDPDLRYSASSSTSSIEIILQQIYQFRKFYPSLCILKYLLTDQEKEIANLYTSDEHLYNENVLWNRCIGPRNQYSILYYKNGGYFSFNPLTKFLRYQIYEYLLNHKIHEIIHGEDQHNTEYSCIKENLSHVLITKTTPITFDNHEEEDDEQNLLAAFTRVVLRTLFEENLLHPLENILVVNFEGVTKRKFLSLKKLQYRRIEYFDLAIQYQKIMESVIEVYELKNNGLFGRHNFIADLFDENVFYHQINTYYPIIANLLHNCYYSSTEATPVGAVPPPCTYSIDEFVLNKQFLGELLHCLYASQMTYPKAVAAAEEEDMSTIYVHLYSSNAPLLYYTYYNWLNSTIKTSMIEQEQLCPFIKYLRLQYDGDHQQPSLVFQYNQMPANGLLFNIILHVTKNKSTGLAIDGEISFPPYHPKYNIKLYLQSQQQQQQVQQQYLHYQTIITIDNIMQIQNVEQLLSSKHLHFGYFILIVNDNLSSYSSTTPECQFLVKLSQCYSIVSLKDYLLDKSKMSQWNNSNSSIIPPPILIMSENDYENLRVLDYKLLRRGLLQVFKLHIKNE